MEEVLCQKQKTGAQMRTSRYARDLKQLYDQRELLWMWTWRDIRVRYKQSVLGVAWAVLQPVSLMLIFSVVFSLIVRVPTGGTPYPLFSYTAVLPWTFFASSIALGVPSLVNNMNLVTKVSMPREILPIAAVLAGLVDFAVAGVLFLGMLVVYRVTLHWTVLWVLPLLVIQMTLSFGVVMLGSALNVIYRDIRFVVPLAMQLWMYMTPIIYPVDLIPERLRAVYYVNPMASVIDGYRRVVLSGSSPDVLGVTIAAAVSVSLLIFSYATFKRLEHVFADII